ncbi:MAG: pitrilysin family protein [bacterium]|nr:pitrilysin family protein [bacterium]
MKKSSFYSHETLKNGLKVVMEKIPYVRSVSLGLWVEAGSRDENKNESGFSHFIEHLLFKGTKKRDARSISSELESVGGRLDAFTGREYTCLSARVLDTHLDLALELISDLYHNSTFPRDELERERQVVLEEIKMSEDIPEDFIFDIFNESIYPDNSLGRPILGYRDIILKLSRDKIFDFYKKYYDPSKTILALCGNFSEKPFIEKTKKYFKSPGSKISFPAKITPEYHQGIKVHTKKLNQVHICLGAEGLEFDHKDRSVIQVLNVMLGGSMSSRLFQEIREKRGLAYSIYSCQSSHKDSGAIMIYAGTAKDKANEVVALILKELNSVKRGKITQAEMNLSKEQLKGNIVLGAESTENRMMRLATCEFYMRKYISLEESIAEIDKVKKDDVIRLAAQIFNPSKLNLTCLGPVSKKEISFNNFK